jgi:hypothetical protein
MGNMLKLNTGNKVISVWAKTNPSGGSDNIYITRVDDAENVGISELDMKQVYVYPNPASGEVSVVLPENMTNAEVSLTDISGKEVLRSYPLTNNQDHNFRISTSNLVPGTYILHVKSANETISQKLIVKQ